MNTILEIIFEVLNVLIGDIFDNFIFYIAKGYLPKKFIKQDPKEAKAIMAIMSISAFVALLASVIMLIVNDGRSILGWVLLLLAVLYNVLGIVLSLLRKIRFYDYDE